jgi:hypothetical protein
MRSFGLVDDKLCEADFFLEKLAACGGGRPGDDGWFAAKCYFSAFTSAARSVTFALQSSLSDLPGFSDWYAGKRTEMRADRLATFFNRARTESQHIGFNPVNAGTSGRGSDGRPRELYWFADVGGAGMELPQEDVVTACHAYMVNLVRLVYECYLVFGEDIDPAQYYTLNNLRRRGVSIEDVEEEFGYPRGWTGLPGATDAQRLEVLRRTSMPDSGIDPIFDKYLEKVRPCKPVI